MSVTFSQKYCVLREALRFGVFGLVTSLGLGFNPRTAGGQSHLRTAGGGGGRMTSPENSKTKKDSEKR